MGLGHFRQPRQQGRLTLRGRAAGALLALAALALVPAPALGQSVTVTAQGRAAVLSPGTITKLTDMDFGTIVRPTAAGTVTLVPTPVPTCTATASLVHTGACTPAEFTLMGRKNWLVRIREQNGGTLLLSGPGGATMTVTNLSINVSDMVTAPGGGNPPGTFGRYRITSDGGTARFRIGGRLNVAANQAVGTYTGTLNIQVQFN